MSGETDSQRLHRIDSDLRTLGDSMRKLVDAVEKLTLQEARQSERFQQFMDESRRMGARLEAVETECRRVDHTLSKWLNRAIGGWVVAAMFFSVAGALIAKAFNDIEALKEKVLILDQLQKQRPVYYRTSDDPYIPIPVPPVDSPDPRPVISNTGT